MVSVNVRMNMYGQLLVSPINNTFIFLFLSTPASLRMAPVILESKLDLCALFLHYNLSRQKKNEFC